MSPTDRSSRTSARRWLFRTAIAASLGTLLYLSGEIACVLGLLSGDGTTLVGGHPIDSIVGRLMETMEGSGDKSHPMPGTGGAVYVALRESGVKRSHAWCFGEEWRTGFSEALKDAAHGLAPECRPRIDAVEACFANPPRSLSPSEYKQELSNVHRGIRGVVLRNNTVRQAWSPTDMLARNLSFENVFTRFRETASPAGPSHVSVFDAEQFLVLLGDGILVKPMVRGNTYVPLSDVTRIQVQRLADGLGDWLVRQVHDDGRMTYKYWPSRGQESTSNNMIRQFMATVCLEKLAVFRGDPGLSTLARKNLEYNLLHYYREEDSLGLIEYDGKVKLGAVAVAALAIARHPDRQDFEAQEKALARTIGHLWNEDGSFLTFLVPSGRRDNQNFYPGEALLYWAVIADETRDPVLLSRIMKSFEYYSSWHLIEENRNPAFVPWHTQAYSRLWRTTANEALRGFIFQMNDWLLPMQQWEGAPHPDVKGRFYNPDRPEFGPPHASSTGVYLEGLIEAYVLARDAHDSKRVAAYRTAILRGLRSIMQLQFSDEIDMYYISQRAPAEGGLRTTVYHNEIRVDNVQHCLMAVMRILAEFTEDDFFSG